MDKNLPSKPAKKEIKIDPNSKVEIIKRAPDELIAMAIRDTLIKDEEKRKR